MIKVGITGSGFGLYGLLPAFNSTPGCEVIAICGKHSHRFVDYCKSIGLTKTYTNWQEMLNKEDLDALAIAVTPSAQYEIAKTAIKKGLHIFAEKPLAANYKQAEELLNFAKKNNIVHAVDFLFPEIEEWKKVKGLLDKQAYGKLKEINLDWEFLSYDIKNHISSWKTDINKGGGALSFYFSHALYYLEYFGGKILSFKSKLFYSKKSINGGEVGLDLNLEFENGVVGMAHFSCISRSSNKHQLIFICNNGTIILENHDKITDGFITKVITDGKTKIISTPKDKIKKNEDERVNIVKKLTNKFIKAIIQHKQMKPSFKDGTRVQELIEKIRKESS